MESATAAYLADSRWVAERAEPRCQDAKRDLWLGIFDEKGRWLSGFGREVVMSLSEWRGLRLPMFRLDRRENENAV